MSGHQGLPLARILVGCVSKNSPLTLVFPRSSFQSPDPPLLHLGYKFLFFFVVFGLSPLTVPCCKHSIAAVPIPVVITLNKCLINNYFLQQGLSGPVSFCNLFEASLYYFKNMIHMLLCGLINKSSVCLTNLKIIWTCQWAYKMLKICSTYSGIK